MLNARLTELTFAGWMLVAASLGASVAVAIPVGSWALADVDRQFFRENRHWLCCVLAVPALCASVGVFLVGRRILVRGGVAVRRERTIPDPADPPEDDIDALVAELRDRAK